MKQDFSKRKAEIEDQPNICHFDVRSLGELIGDVYEHRSQDLREDLYRSPDNDVPKLTNITVKFTETTASKKNGLK